MITYKNGNILNATETIIGQQVNCMGVMEAGLAQQIADRYLEVPTKYYNKVNEYKKENKLSELIGNVQYIKIKDDQYICNFFSQMNFGKEKKYTNYIALKECLQRVKDVIVNLELTLALPYGLGCGKGGGDWKLVESIIEEVFNDYKVTIYKK